MCVLKEVAQYMAFRKQGEKRAVNPIAPSGTCPWWLGSPSSFYSLPVLSQAIHQVLIMWTFGELGRYFRLTVINYLFNSYCKQITKVQEAKGKKILIFFNLLSLFRHNLFWFSYRSLCPVLSSSRVKCQLDIWLVTSILRSWSV